MTQEDKPIILVCGLGLPWQRGLWEVREVDGRIEVVCVQSPTSKERTKPRGRGIPKKRLRK